MVILNMWWSCLIELIEEYWYWLLLLGLMDDIVSWFLWDIEMVNGKGVLCLNYFIFGFGVFLIK